MKIGNPLTLYNRKRINLNEFNLNLFNKKIQLLNKIKSKFRTTKIMKAKIYHPENKQKENQSIFNN